WQKRRRVGRGGFGGLRHFNGGRLQLTTGRDQILEIVWPRCDRVARRQPVSRSRQAEPRPMKGDRKKTVRRPLRILPPPSCAGRFPPPSGETLDCTRHT